MKELAPGLYPNIRFLDYLAIDAVHFSRHLKAKTMAHLRWMLTHPEADTGALRLGDAVHAAVLEPERFTREYCASPKFDKRTNTGKAAAAKWTSEHGEQSALMPSEWDWATAIRDSVLAHPLASEVLKGPGQNELTCIWKDAVTGLLCKSRLDRFTKFQGWSTVFDLKTTADAADPRTWGRTCAKYRYHVQEAFYLDGLAALAPGRRRFIHLVVEKEGPYCVALHELEDPDIEEGRQQYRKVLDMYAHCLKSNEWPGYPVGVEAVNLPPWAYQETSFAG